MDTIGKYQILEKIGVGGFGVVYKARDPFIKRLVAVKTCSSEHEEIRRRFFREAEIAGNLQHRNVTTVHDFGVQDEVPYLVQEFLSGEDLEEFIGVGHPLDDPTKIDVLVQIGEGLEYAHRKGVVHRDIKPGNIRILESGRVKIMDFGIAKLTHATSRFTKTGMTLGTSAYLAPEQIQGEEITKAADIYAFGVVAYELLTGQRPFRGETVSALFFQILHRDPVPMAELWTGSPPELVAIVERCLEKDPRDRYESFSDLLEELRPIRHRLTKPSEDVPDRFVRDSAPDEEAPTTAMPSGSVPRRAGSPRRSRSRVAVSVAGGIVLVGSLVVAVFYLSRDQFPAVPVRTDSTGTEERGEAKNSGAVLPSQSSVGGRRGEPEGALPAVEEDSDGEGESRPGPASGDEPPRGAEVGTPIGEAQGTGTAPSDERGSSPATSGVPGRAEVRDLPGSDSSDEGVSGRSGATSGAGPGRGPDLAAIDELARRASVATEVESRRARAAEKSRSSTPIWESGSSRPPGRSGGSSRSETAVSGPAFADSRSSRDEIGKVVDGYAAAYEALDFQALRALFPSAPRDLVLTFEGYRSLDLSLTDCTIDRESDRARVQCRMRQTVELEGGGSRSEEGTVALVLERRDRRWLIMEGIRSR
ncbi:MAG: protein kinase [Thermoanaerobaculia bacterium]|nr:protein kinase [Thermoanaerobaculia bacterium]